ncbi:hypothetical protein DOTSEDRAFT_75630 [Dothistroma septosporum NZE10]|uniref:Inositolphosphotransferase Aur1/Ipt1 domain-containing protein n=1 Tax=Dothistroma septosporum (strain NZE10 / CBS 128990) TaxID=675120 RepID=M2XHR6_DOTSN|nr:hypothetical protein DOTSEDRAFT_75630 [Dothistroma septosporum NZE10]
MAHHNGTMPDLGKPQSEARAWFEPVLVVSIMAASLYFNRDRTFSIIPSQDERYDASSEYLIKTQNGEYEESRSSSRSASPDRPKDSIDQQRGTSPSQRNEDVSPSSMNFPSRILQKFPFLIEMFYWALNYVAYAMTKKLGAALYSRYDGQNQVTELAQQNGIDILTFEHDTIFSIFFPMTEVAFQQFFIKHHLMILSFFNQIYSLVHIPGTVAFLSWYYYVAPSHDTFATVRRTMTLGNFSAFFIFSLYPCMPPRLLPESFGFKDTVRQDNAESVWVGGANVNQLAAMPSLHFTYAFVIGCTFLFQSGVLATCFGRRASVAASRTSRSWRSNMSVVYAVAGAVYPILVLSVIVATANHYYLDAVVATFSVTLCFFINRIWIVLLPAERLLCKVLRLRKPTPTTARNSIPERPRVVVEQWA